MNIIRMIVGISGAILLLVSFSLATYFQLHLDSNSDRELVNILHIVDWISLLAGLFLVQIFSILPKRD